MKTGAALVNDGTDIYALQGDGKPDLYKYDIAGNSWTTMAPAPENIKDGGALTYDGTYIYVLDIYMIYLQATEQNKRTLYKGK